MAHVEVRPAGIELEVDDGETIIEAAWRLGFTWPTVCRGKGSCRACVLQIASGADAFAPVGSWEREGLDLVTPSLPGDASSYRLACQATVSGDAVVVKTGVRPKPSS